MMSDREWEILQLLVKRKKGYFTSIEMASELNVSDRTVRTHIKELAIKVREYGAEIISKPSIGYALQIHNNYEFSLFLFQVSQDKKARKDASQLEKSSDREYFLLKKMLFEETVLSIEVIAEDLMISLSAMNSLITDIRKRLQSYNLKVINVGKQFFYIEGNERNKRMFIIDYFFENQNENALLMEDGSTFFNDSMKLAEITMIVLDECREAKLRLSDFVINNLIIHIALSLERLKKGFELKDFKITDEIRGSLEYSVALNILKRIEKLLNFEFPMEEAKYIALHLKVKTNTINMSQPNISSQIREALTSLYEETAIDLREDFLLIEGLEAHFSPLLIRLKNGLYLKNPLLQQIKEKYQEVLDLTVKYFAPLSVISEFNVSEDEWSYIALHVLAAIERFRNTRKIKTLIICATGYGSAQMLKTQIETKFGNVLNIVETKSYYELTDQAIEGIELIISSIDLSHIILPIPVLLSNVFLSEKDIERIQRFIDQFHQLSPTINPQCDLVKEKDVHSIFNLYFSPERFIIASEKTTREDLLKTMISLMEEDVEENFLPNLKKQIELRENYSSIVIDRVLAFPHPAIPIGIKGQIVVALCPKGVYWNEENPDVKFVFLMSPSKVNNIGWENIPESLVTIVQNEKLKTAVLESESFHSFEEKFIQIMEKKYLVKGEKIK